MARSNLTALLAEACPCPLLQVQKWTRDQVHSFWERWYFPANATLYVAGDFGMRVPDVERLIQNTFGRIPAGRHKQLSSDNGRQPSDGELKKRHEVGSVLMTLLL